MEIFISNCRRLLMVSSSCFFLNILQHFFICKPFDGLEYVTRRSRRFKCSVQQTQLILPWTISFRRENVKCDVRTSVKWWIEYIYIYLLNPWAQGMQHHPSTMGPIPDQSVTHRLPLLGSLSVGPFKLRCHSTILPWRKMRMFLNTLILWDEKTEPNCWWRTQKCHQILFIYYCVVFSNLFFYEMKLNRS